MTMRGFILVIFTKYHHGAQIEGDRRVGQAESMVKMRNGYKIFVARRQRDHLENLVWIRPRYIKTDLKDSGCEGVNWIFLAQVRGRWRALVGSTKDGAFLGLVSFY
jgi:hypothetical protein